MMDGLDCLGADEIGFDFMSIASAVPGLLSGAGGMLSGGGAGGGAPAAAAEKARLEEEKRKAEQSARTMKTVLIVVGSLLGVGGIVAAVTLGRK